MTVESRSIRTIAFSALAAISLTTVTVGCSRHVRGIVIDAYTRAPIDSVKIRVHWGGFASDGRWENGSYVIVPEDGGQFRIPADARGTMVFSKDGYMRRNIFLPLREYDIMSRHNSLVSDDGVVVLSMVPRIDPAPVHILARAEAFMRVHLGSQFFDENMVYRTMQQDVYRGDWNVEYWVRPRGLPGAYTVLDVRVPWEEDTRELESIYGVPDCVRNPNLCEFPITRQIAIEIAERSGFTATLEPLTSWFSWDRDLNEFVWAVSAVRIREYAHRETEILIISASSGDILGRRDDVMQ